MRKVVLTMLALALCCGASFAACLLDDYSVSAEFSRSAVVALARVVSERQVPEQKEAGLLDGTLYSLRVQETYRGQASRTRSVFSENSSGRFPMVVGQTYIVFLYLQSGRLSADYCGNSGLASDKQNVVNEVRAAARVR